MTLAREVRRLALPAIGTSLLQTAIFLIDRIMLGRHGPTDLAAIQIAGSVEWSLFALMSAFTVGTLARVGMAKGAGDREGARKAIAVSIATALGLGSLLALATFPVLALLPKFFPAASVETLEGAKGYLQATMLASPAMLLATTVTAAMQGSGDTRTPFAVGIVTVILHIALNRLLILGGFGIPALGVRGAGISTALTFVFEAIVLAYLLARRLREEGPTRREPLFRGAREEVHRIGRIAWPAVIERAMLHTGFLLYSGIIGLLGDTAMAANQGLISVESICFLSADGFGVAAAAIVAKKIGEGKPEEARAAAKVATRSAVILLSLFGVVIWLLRWPMLAAFSSEAAVLALAVSVTPVLSLAQPFMAAGMVLSQSVRGAGATRIALAVSVIGSLVVRVPATYLLSIRWEMGLAGAWIGSTLDWVVRAALLGALIGFRGDRILRDAVSRFAMRAKEPVVT